MAKLKEIRKRIASIKNTRQVTSAMKMVSAAKLKKAQDRILQIAPYDKKMREIVQSLSLEESSDIPYFIQPEIENVLVIVVGTNQGLCGGFNSNASKFSMAHVISHYDDLFGKGCVHFFPIGRQVERVLKSNGVTFAGEQHQLMNEILYGDVSLFAQQLMELFTSGKYQRIDIVYNKFKNAAVQELTADQYLPILKPEKTKENPLQSANYIFEPSKKEILESLIPQWLVMHLFRILLDSNTAEQGARMTAMHQATDNATELLKDLTVKYNNARQSAITNEIVEITAGAEALKG
ncbi:MAG TPA: ATP synthase F1 subunit gamma [Prolixibacteraceae bacterium]|nr:ATP synthase F1 subunit gamma [Prolixibacteraceae bacterium]